jgi:hypothetical protein
MKNDCFFRLESKLIPKYHRNVNTNCTQGTTRPSNVKVTFELTPNAHELQTWLEHLGLTRQGEDGATASNNADHGKSRKPWVVPNGKYFRQLIPEDILYVTANGNYCDIHFINGDKMAMVSVYLGQMAEYLDNRGFVRIHDSHLANISQMKDIGRDRVIMRTDVALTVGRKYRAALFGCFERHGTTKTENKRKPRKATKE